MKIFGQNMPILRRILLTFPPIVAGLLIVKIFILDFYRISSDSMMPSLLVGDFVVISKIYPKIEKDEIIAFELPERAAEVGNYDRKSIFVKRIIAMPNDTISVVGDTIFINGRKTNFAAERMKSIFGTEKFIVPGKGTMLDIAPENENVWRPLVEFEKHSIVIKNRIVFIDGNPAVGFNLTQNFYFVAGDNAADSYDSRYWGLLPEKTIIGSPILIYWSVSGADGIRLGRIGTIR